MRLMSDADEGDAVIFVECYLSFVRPGSTILLKHRSDALESSETGQRVSFTYKAYRVQSLGTPSCKPHARDGSGPLGTARGRSDTSEHCYSVVTVHASRSARDP